MVRGIWESRLIRATMTGLNRLRFGPWQAFNERIIIIIYTRYCDPRHARLRGIAPAVISYEGWPCMRAGESVVSLKVIGRDDFKSRKELFLCRGLQLPSYGLPLSNRGRQPHMDPEIRLSRMVQLEVAYFL